MNAKEEIKKLIQRAVKSLGECNLPILVEIPNERTHGDYSTNIALVLSKSFKKTPIEIARQIVSRMGKQKIFEKVEIAGPGFINFYLSKEVFTDNLEEVLKDKDFGKNKNLKNQKVIIEYTDPNPFKEFHIGHLMSNSIGESLSRIFEFQGTKVKRANYQGDVGLHVAKAILGWEVFRNYDINPEDTLSEKINFLNRCYALGSAGTDTLLQWEAFNEHIGLMESIIEERNKRIEAGRLDYINKAIYNKSDPDINTMYLHGRDWSLQYFKEIYEKLGTNFDYYFFESEVADAGKKIVEENLEKVFEKGEKGAIVFRGEKYGLHTRVFVNSEGLPTYEAKELGLAKVKYDKFKYDKSVIVTGNEVNEYFKVLLAAMSEIFPDLAKKTFHIGHGMMRLPEGKMSSRTGKVVTFEFLLDTVETLIKEKIAERGLSPEEQDEIAEKVAIGALKYSILKQSIGSDIMYDFEKSISFEGDSGPYLQYSYARARSVLKKARTERIKPSLKHIPSEVSHIEKMIHYFPEVVEKAGKEYEPHFITLYLTELARDFNNYYAREKIVDKNDEFSPYKIALTEALSTVMKNGLWLLGIPTPNRM